MNLVISAPEEVIAPAQLIMRLPPDAAMSADDFLSSAGAIVTCALGPGFLTQYP